MFLVLATVGEDQHLADATSAPEVEKFKLRYD